MDVDRICMKLPFFVLKWVTDKHINCDAFLCQKIVFLQTRYKCLIMLRHSNLHELYILFRNNFLLLKSKILIKTKI